MVLTTPGIDFLARSIAFLSIPLVLALGAQRLLSGSLDYHIPTWVVLTGSFIIIPIFTTARIWYLDVKHARHAAALGARFVPRVKGKWFGNLDVLLEMRENWQRGYPGGYC